MATTSPAIHLGTELQLAWPLPVCQPGPSKLYLKNPMLNLTTKQMLYSFEFQIYTFNCLKQTDVSLLSLEKGILMRVENKSQVPHLYFSWQWAYQGPHMRWWVQSPKWWPCPAPLAAHQFPLLLPRIQNRASEYHVKPHQNQEKMSHRTAHRDS